MSEGRLAVGLVVGLDYPNPLLDPHERFQQFKTHPFVRGLLRGGTVVSCGAKANPEGGYWAIPRAYCDGGLIVGDSAGFLNAMRLKGIHLALKTGMLAAQASFEALRAGEVSASRLKRFEELVEASWVQKELWQARSFYQAFARGLWIGMLHAGFQVLTGGRGLRNRYRSRPGHERMRTIKDYFGSGPIRDHRPQYDGKLTFDKLTDVYYSGTVHDEDQPAHLIVLDPEVCWTRCQEEYGNPCQRFCPAAVYDVTHEGGQMRLQINASNCVHCKTCDIMDPYEVIRWVPPEGGGGPRYELL